MAIYCKARGIPEPDPVTYAFCMALSIFRGAAILAGVGARAQQGNASSAKAAQASSVQGSERIVSMAFWVSGWWSLTGPVPVLPISALLLLIVVMVRVILPECPELRCLRGTGFSN